MNVKFTREKADDNGRLPFLDVKLSLKNGLETTRHRKSMKKDIILNVDSAHPSYTKANTVNASTQLSEILSSNKHKADTQLQAINIITSNGYEETYTRKRHSEISLQ